MANFISDEDMAELERDGKAKPIDLRETFKPKPLTDAEMEALEKRQSKKLDESNDAFLQGLGEGGTMGYGAQIQSAMLPAIAKVDSWINDTDYERTMQDLGDYTTRRDKLIKRRETLAEENPKAYTGGQVAGALASSVVPVGIAAKSAAGAGKLAKAAHAAKTGAKVGLIQGAIANPGDIEGEVDILQPGRRLENAGEGAAAGALLSGGANVAGQGLTMTAKGLKDLAEKRAFKALGPYAREAQKAYEKGGIQELGRLLLDKGVVNFKPTSYQGIAKRADAAKEVAGKQLDNVLSELDEKARRLAAGEPGLIRAGSQPPGVRAGIDRKAIANSMREDLLSKDLDIPGVARKNTQVERLIRQFEEGQDDLIPLLQAEAKKRATGKEIKWDRLPGADIPVTEQVQRSLYGKLRKGVEDGAETLDNMFNGKNAGAFKKAKKDFGGLEEASRIANKRESKEFANRFLSPSDYGVAGVGGVAGFASGDTFEERVKNAAAGASLGVANKFARQQGNQLVAAGADRLSKAMMKTPRFAQMAEKNPVAFQRMVSAMSARPEFEATQETNFEQSNELIKILQQRPDLLEKIQNPRLKEQLRRRVETAGELDEDSSQNSNYQPSGEVDNEKAKKDFIRGN